MKLADMEGSKPVAICDRSALFGFTNPTSTEIPRIKKSALAAANIMPLAKVNVGLKR